MRDFAWVACVLIAVSACGCLKQDYCPPDLVDYGGDGAPRSTPVRVYGPGDWIGSMKQMFSAPMKGEAPAAGPADSR